MPGGWPGIIAATGLNNTKLENVHEAPEDVSHVSADYSPIMKVDRTRLSLFGVDDVRKSNTRACDRPVTRCAERSDDERRLLGDYEKDADAVPIICPHNPTWHDSMTPGIIHGGPKPSNTLGSGGSTSQKIRDDVKGAASYRIKGLKRTCENGFKGGLDTVASSGDNVVNSVKAFDITGDWGQEPAKKKLRTTANSGIQSDSRHTLTMDDDDLMALFDQGKIGRVNPLLRSASYNSSIRSQGSEVNSNSRSLRARTGRLHNEEYRTNEEMMRVRHSRRSKRRPRCSQPVARSSGTTPPTIDLSEDDDDVISEIKRPYQGKARETKSRGTSTRLVREKHRDHPVFRERENQTKSRQFQDSRRSRLSSSMRASKAPPTGQQVKQLDLRTSFVDDKGNRRDSLMEDSSDELQNGTTVGSHTREPQNPPTQMPLDSRKPLEDTSTRPVTPPRQVLGLPESNIRSTDFTSSGRRAGKINRAKEELKARKPSSDWGAELMSYRRGRAELNDQIGSRLVYDQNKGQFVVKQEGQDLAEDDPEFGINPTRVARIWRGDVDSSKLRLFLSRSDNADDRIDIELRTNEHVEDLVQKLQHLTPGIKIVKKTSAKMNQVFENRPLEKDPHLLITKHHQTSNSEDIQLLVAKDWRRKAKRQMLESENEVYGKRRSSEVSVDAIAELGEMSIPWHHRPSDPLQRTITAGQNRDGGFKTHQRQSSNQHQTRSQIQQSANDIQIPKRPGPEQLPEKRYSKVHGLGSQWPKPLVFPQAGKRKATVEWKDLQRLDEGEFLNDNLIGFYLRYLEHRLEQRHDRVGQKIYFFNTYFFASLTNTPKGKKGINYEAVEKWTRTVDIFAFDYVVVPINESAHWYLALICNLPALDRNLEAVDELDVEPAVNIALSSDDVDDHPSVSSQAPSSSVVDEFENRAAIADIDTDNTRTSFAQLNLEGMQGPYTHDMAQDKMIQAGVSPLCEEDESLGQPIRLDQEMTKASPSTGQLSKGSSPSSAKKGRRKSIARLQKYEPGSPIIITLDSLGLSHSPTVRILKDYLAQEGRAKRALDYPDDAIKGMTAKGVPFQKNFCDCGVYLLGYLNKLVQDPQDLCRKILQRELDAERDWPDLDSSQIRNRLRAQIQELQSEQEAERIENAKKTGRYINKGHTKHNLGLGAPEPSPSVTHRTADKGSNQDPKASLESALKSVTRVDRDPSPKAKLVKQPTMTKPSLEDLTLEEKAMDPAVSTTPRQEDSPVFLGETRVRTERARSRAVNRPMEGPKGDRVHASGKSMTPSPTMYLEKVEIMSTHPRPGDGDMLEV